MPLQYVAVVSTFAALQSSAAPNLIMTPSPVVTLWGGIGTWELSLLAMQKVHGGPMHFLHCLPSLTLLAALDFPILLWRFSWGLYCVE